MNTKERAKLILVGILTAAASVLTYAQTMTVVVKNVKGDAGIVRVTVYNTAEQFLEKGIATTDVKAVNGQIVAEFKNLNSGSYAISVVHDANNNKELDSNFIGMPEEGFGFSNDAMGMFGPPDFKKALFEYSGKQEVVINLRYL